MRGGRATKILALSALLPLAMLALVLGVVALRNQQSALEDGARERVARIAALTERELRTQVELLQLLAVAPELDDPQADGERLRELLTRARVDRPLWVAISLSDTAGQRLFDVPAPIGGAQGRVIDLDSHRRTVATAAPQIGPMLRGPRDRVAFALRVPVLRGEGGETRFVLTAVIEPAQFRDILQAAGVPDGWTGAILDRDGRFVARTMGPAGLVGQPASDGARAAARSRPAGTYEGRTLEGVATMTAFQTIAGSDWSVHIAVPRELYQAPITRSLWLMIGGGVLTLGLVAVFVVLLVRERAQRHAAEVAAQEAQHLEALGRMTGGVAHDFNNLLMIVQGAATAVRRHRANPERMTAFLDAILAACERGAAITRQLLAFARRSPHEVTSFDLANRLPRLEPLIAGSMRADIAVTIDVAPGTALVRADPNALEVALINLAINARDAMPDGGRLIVAARNASLAKGTDDGTGLRGDFVAIDVSDTGTGIAPEHLSRVFEPFFTTKGSSKGTGLGLSQVFGFARQSDGGVAIESTVGRGTRVTLYLPRGVAAPDTQDAERVSVAPSPAGRRVLVVEDDPAVASVTADMLAEAGYVVTVASDAPSALSAIERGGPYDAVVSDIMLGPGPSGIELARSLRARDATQVIVLVTGYSETLAGGAQGFPVLAKPFRRDDLVAAITAARGAPAPTLLAG